MQPCIGTSPSGSYGGPPSKQKNGFVIPRAAPERAREVPSRRDYGPVAGSRGQGHNKNPRYIKKGVRGKSDKGKD